MDEAAEEVAPVHVGQRRSWVASGYRGGARLGRLEVERAVRPSVVVVAHVDAEDLLELAAAEDQQAIEALAADAADPALNVRVAFGARTGVRTILMPSLVKTASNAAENLLSRS